MEEENKSFLKEYSLTPISSIFSLAQEVIIANYKLIYLNLALCYGFMWAIYFSAQYIPQEEEALAIAFLSIIVIALFGLVFITFMVSNLLYYINIVKTSQNIIELHGNVKNISIKDFYTKYFFSALGYLFAIMVMFLFIFLFMQLIDSISKLFAIPFLLIIILFVYSHIAVLEKVSNVTTFKSGFKTFFLTFNFNFLKKISTFSYVRLVFLFEWIYSMLSKLSDVPAKLVSKNEESYAFLFTDFLFASIFTIFATVILVAMASVMAKELIDEKSKS